jgi:hypothetical protein
MLPILVGFGNLADGEVFRDDRCDAGVVSAHGFWALTRASGIPKQEILAWVRGVR